jgi:hypothetical protein
MGVTGAEFLGKVYFRPGARGTFRAKRSTSSQGQDLTTLILIGTSSNGNYFADPTLTQEEKVMEFANATDAYAILGNGDLADAVKNCFPPSRDARFTGPQVVKCINVNENIRATSTVVSIETGVDHTIEASIPGPKGNTFRLNVSSGGSVLQYGDSTGITQTQPFETDVMTIEYIGNGTSAILQVSNAQLLTTITGQTDSSLSLSIDFSDYRTVGDLVEFINSNIGYSATILGSSDFLCQNMDAVLLSEGISILATPYTVSGLFYSQKSVLEASGLFRVVAGSSQKPIADTASFVYLSGGATGTSSTQDFLDALDFVKETQENGFFLNVLTTNTAVASRMADFAQYANSPDGSREVFTGWGVDITLPFDQRIDLVRSINSEFTVTGISPVKTFQADGITEKTFPGWMVAVIHNAMKASANMRETPTYRDLNIIDAPEKLSSAQIDKAIQSGALVVDRKPNKGPFKITFAVTSYQKQNEILNQSSTVCTALAMVKYLREQLEANFVGEVPVDPATSNGTFTDSDIRTFVDNLIKIDFIQRFGYLTRNVYTGQAAFDFNYTIERDGGIVYFRFPNGNLVSPINFMFFLLELDLVRGSSNGGN